MQKMRMNWNAEGIKCNVIKTTTLMVLNTYILFVNGQHSNIQYILLWTNPRHFTYPSIKVGNKSFIENKCLHQNCIISNKFTHVSRNITKYDAILFNAVTLQKQPLLRLPKKHSEKQKYILVSSKSAVEYPITDKYNNFFHWTWTYKLDSDISNSYMVIKDKNGEVIGPKQNMHWIPDHDMKQIHKKIISKLQYKTTAAAWIVSNCDEKKQHESYIQKLRAELRKYNHVLDIFGKCGDKNCPEEKIEKCYTLLESKYYFYLSFEDSIAEDYVTDQLLIALNHFTVPVVFGGANYSRFMPDGIYLDALELGPVKLANRMNDIIGNRKAYYNKFRWHDYYSFHSPSDNPDTNGICELCNLLNNHKRRAETKVYPSIVKWFNDRKDWNHEHKDINVKRRLYMEKENSTDVNKSLSQKSIKHDEETGRSKKPINNTQNKTYNHEVNLDIEKENQSLQIRNNYKEERFLVDTNRHTNSLAFDKFHEDEDEFLTSVENIQKIINNDVYIDVIRAISSLDVDCEHNRQSTNLIDINVLNENVEVIDSTEKGNLIDAMKRLEGDMKKKQDSYNTEGYTAPFEINNYNEQQISFQDFILNNEINRQSQETTIYNNVKKLTIRTSTTTETTSTITGTTSTITGTTSTTTTGTTSTTTETTSTITGTTSKTTETISTITSTTTTKQNDNVADLAMEYERLKDVITRLVRKNPRGRNTSTPQINTRISDTEDENQKMYANKAENTQINNNEKKMQPTELYKHNEPQSSTVSRNLRLLWHNTQTEKYKDEQTNETEIAPTLMTEKENIKVTIKSFVKEYMNKGQKSYTTEIKNNYVEEKKKRLFNIFIWTSKNYSISPILKMGRTSFIENNCAFSNCVLSNKYPGTTQIINYDAMIFNAVSLREQPFIHLPGRRAAHQKYILVSAASAANYPISIKYNNFFNWTWTYKLDSDISFAYIAIKDKNGTVIGPKQNMNWIPVDKMDETPEETIKKLQTKTTAAGWIVSDCYAVYNHETYITNLRNELRKYNYVLNIFGECGNMKCPNNDLKECYALLEKEYYFHLSFEDSMAEDYVTDQLLIALLYYTVPVVYGGANYTRFMPDGIYLDAFELGPAKLARKMSEIIKQRQLYNNMFKWRNYYTYSNPLDDPNVNGICTLCRLLNDDHRRNETTVYKNIVKWFNDRSDWNIANELNTKSIDNRKKGFTVNKPAPAKNTSLEEFFDDNSTTDTAITGPVILYYTEQKHYNFEKDKVLHFFTEDPQTTQTESPYLIDQVTIYRKRHKHREKKRKANAKQNVVTDTSISCPDIVTCFNSIVRNVKKKVDWFFP